MLSYLTEPLRKLFSSKNAYSHKRKREKSSMIPLEREEEEDQPVSKRCRRGQQGSVTAPVDQSKPKYLSGSQVLGNYIQDWFLKIGQMAAAKPIETFNIDHVTSATDYREADEDDEDDDGSEPEIVELGVSNGIKKNSLFSQALTREPLHSGRTLNVTTNGHDNQHWEEDVWEDAESLAESSNIEIIPSTSRNGTGSVRPKTTHPLLQPLDEQQSDYSPAGSTVPSFFRRYCSRSKRHSKSSTPLEPIRLGEREQYRMLLEQCKVGTPEETSYERARWHSFHSSASQQRTGTVPGGVSKVRLSDVSKRGLMDRLSFDSELKKKSALKEGKVKGQNSICVPKYLSLRPDTSAADSIVGSLHPKQLDLHATSKYESAERKSRCEKWEAQPPAIENDDSVKIVDQIHRRRSMPVTQKAMFSKEWLNDIQLSVDDCCKSRAKKEEMLEKITREFREKREAKIFDRNRKSLHRLVKSLNLKTTDASEEDEEDMHLLELTTEMERAIDEALRPTPPKEVLCEGFRLSIARRDMETLAGLNWLNDEIINFYMNLLMERGKNDNFPSVYAFNTFFYPKLTSGGHAALRRWTRQVDIFSYHYVLIPVHLGMHWCLAVIDFKQKKIQYYDSMGGQNNECVNALKNYLQEERRDKKKEEFDMTDWKFETVKNIPQQMNGSDCGMFTLKYAEYITRNAKITFSQRHMPYFRRRMVYEIVTKTLL